MSSIARYSTSSSPCRNSSQRMLVTDMEWHTSGPDSLPGSDPPGGYHTNHSPAAPAPHCSPQHVGKHYQLEQHLQCFKVFVGKKTSWELQPARQNEKVVTKTVRAIFAPQYRDFCSTQALQRWRTLQLLHSKHCKGGVRSDWHGFGGIGLIFPGGKQSGGPAPHYVVNFINLSNISNILRHLYGRTHM